jgi:hypothetical protein
MEFDFTRRQRQLCDTGPSRGEAFARPQSTKAEGALPLANLRDLGDANAPVDTSA